MLRNRRARILALSLCATAAALPLGSPAAAESARPLASSTVLLSVIPAEPAGGPIQQALLRCDADGGTHRAATAACDDLRSVGGDIRALATEDGICTREYRPVTAVAMGVWRGEPLSYRATFSNRCLLLLATGDVFNF
ncbi:SSI family serine proteinase inhibitor [Actinoplanes sandaracinus]|nr:SSI family serine proteinase inhibitor [Actinoplanes sandaracinus]